MMGNRLPIQKAKSQQNKNNLEKPIEKIPLTKSDYVARFGKLKGNPNLPVQLNELLTSPQVGMEEAIENAWSPTFRSGNVVSVVDDPFMVRRLPVAQQTDAVWSNKAYSEGIHLFQLTWSVRQRGTHASVGLVQDTVPGPLFYSRYICLIGFFAKTWGWDLNNSKIHHCSSTNSSTAMLPDYPAKLAENEVFVVPSDFFMVLDMEKGVCGFMVDGCYLGDAFTNLKGKAWRIAISCVWGHCQVSLQYVHHLPAKTPPMLTSMVVKSIQKMVDYNYSLLAVLPVPTHLMSMLAGQIFRNERFQHLWQSDNVVKLLQNLVIAHYIGTDVFPSITEGWNIPLIISDSNHNEMSGSSMPGPSEPMSSTTATMNNWPKLGHEGSALVT